MHAALPGAQAIRAAADGFLVELLVADFLHIGLRHDGELYQLRHQHRVGGLGVQRDLGGAGDLGAMRSGRTGESCGLLNAGSMMRRTREDDVVRRQPAAVLEHDVRAQVEDDGRVVGVAPGGGDLRDDLAGDVAGDKVVEDVAVDRVALGVPLQMRVHGGDVAGQIDGQRVLGLRQGRRGGDSHENGEGDAAHG